jgi:signal transduction histidine kinase
MPDPAASARPVTDQVVEILIVDDEDRNLDALAVILADPGYELLRARSGDEALRVLLRHEVAAIVLDVRMPGLSGYELAQLIKGSQRHREIPIVFLTAHLLDDEDVVAGYGAGAVDYLTKPVNPSILRQKIAVFADLFRKTRELAYLNETLEARVRERTADLQRSEAALQAAAKQKDEFLATLAHELRNPLAPLRMGLDLLLRAQPPLQDFGRTLSIMNKQLDHMVRLIDDLLDVARISGGMLELKKEHAALLPSVQNAIEACRPFFEKRRQSVALHAPVTLRGLIDPTRLTQIVANLLHNAAKFSPEGAELRVELSYQDGKALIKVIDSGLGIDPAQLAGVFDMFSRIQPATAGANKGLGIGLALSRRLAEMHDGTLTAHSQGAGKGSVFTLALPAEHTGAVASEAPPALPAAKLALNVVIIEDNHDSAEVLSMWLENVGSVVQVANDGASGLALVAQVRPRVVLCDIGLPDMNGNDVCRKIRESSLDPQPMMIALTGWGMSEDRQRTREAGFDHHLVKPVAPEKLLELIGGLS